MTASRARVYIGVVASAADSPPERLDTKPLNRPGFGRASAGSANPLDGLERRVTACARPRFCVVPGMIQSSGNGPRRRVLRVVRWVSACSIAMFHCAAALAEPSASELAVARRLFAEAEALERDGRWSEALARLQDAIAIKETPGLRFHAAHVEEKLGRLVEAAADYDRAEDLIARGMSAPDVEQLLQGARTNLERRLPLLVVLVPANVRGLSVELDGRPLATSVVGRPTPVDIGPHHVVARAPGYRSFIANVSLEQGEHLPLRVKLELEPVPVTSAKSAPTRHVAVAPKPQPTLTRRPSHARTYVLIGESAVSLAALSVGGGFLLTLPSAYDRFRSERDQLGPGDCAVGAPPPTGTGSCAGLHAAVRNYQRAEWLGYGGLAAGGVSLLATTLTYLIWPASPATVRASVGPGGSWLGLNGQF